MRTNILQAKKALLALFAMLMPLFASAHDFEKNGIYYNITSEENKTVEVTFRGDDHDSYANEYTGSIIIPSTVTYEGLQYSVTTIGEGAFRGCTALHSITISEGITSISEDAFNSCCFLHSVSIPASVEKISERTFILCSKLTTITIDNKNPVYSDEEDNAIVEKSTKTLIAGTTVGIPAGIDSIANFAFGGRSFSAQDVIIPEGVTAIGRYAFIGCTANRIHIPSTLKKIDMQAFLYLDYATYIEEIHIKDLSAWLDIDFGHFESNPLLSEANLYLNGELLDTIITPQNISAIKKYAFAGWSGKEIIITENVKHIESYVFVDCPKLTDVYCYAENVPNTDTRAFRRFNIEKATLYVPASAIESYKSTVPWSSFGKIESIKTSVSAITFNHPSVILVEGESISLTATISPDDATDSSVTWSSSNEDVAMVSSKGKVVALAAGTATITATANDGSGVSASCEVTVIEPSYTITYLVDGEVHHRDTLIRGAAIVPIENPIKVGHTFSGWGEVPETMPANDVVIEGTFIANKYHVTFKVGDEVIAANTLEYGAAIVAPEAPEKEGHTFNGWGDVAETVPASDVTYEGSYSINSYTLTYVVDGNIYHETTVEYGDAIELIGEPIMEGYVFSGWSEIPETMPANDVTIEGTFTQLPSVFLTINQADNGYVKQHLTMGTVCTFTIEAAEGWKIHSVTFNGEDVTSQLEEGSIYTTPEMLEDAVLNISYEQEVPESVENAHARAIKVRGLDNTIHISGLAEDTTVTLYTTDGAMVAQQQSNAGEAKFIVDTNQVYLVHIGDKVVKIGM